MRLSLHISRIRVRHCANFPRLCLLLRRQPSYRASQAELILQLRYRIVLDHDDLVALQDSLLELLDFSEEHLVLIVVLDYLAQVVGLVGGVSPVRITMRAILCRLLRVEVG